MSEEQQEDTPKTEAEAAAADASSLTHMCNYLTMMAKCEGIDVPIRRKAKTAARNISQIVSSLQKLELDSLGI